MSEEQIDNRADDIESAETVEPEDARSGNGLIKPWDPGKIRITTKNFSLRDAVDQIEDGDIDLSPDFQRDYVWKPRQRTRLIESILLGIPLPAFYFNQTHDGRYQVVDGVQRLSTITTFMRNQHRLDDKDLEYLSDLHGALHADLDPAALRRFRSTQIVVHIIEPQTPDEVKYDIFNRVNTLGSPLSAQEIRHAMSKPRSRAFLGRLVNLDEFDIATEFQFWERDKDTGEAVRDSGRMTNRELALRFCAFRHFSEDTYRQYGSLDAYLIEFTRRIDQRSERHSPIEDDELATLEADFQRGMANGHQILGNAAFRRWPFHQQRRGPINRAVFEAQANALADYDTADLLPYRDRIQQAFRSAFDDSAYQRSVTVATGDPKAVSLRLNVTRGILAGVL
ncbi:DUF262 domain-containing protein [Rhizobium ruizarguesonis]|uniref:DUF262 domain-containing protein n=1 Tax=Rhizobium ruizarguesonis TaxID=2081791 RepID=UPI001031AC0A|nr:DUF262 domain-containing protein [Rhizobium ruizarguesonis]TBD84813.1 DUF262 domain-containing protein [Rhizobium ruizarguesonis]